MEKLYGELIMRIIIQVRFRVTLSTILDSRCS